LVLAALRGYPALPAAMVQAVHSQPPFQLAAAAALRHLTTDAPAAVAAAAAHTTLAAQVQADRETPGETVQRLMLAVAVVVQMLSEETPVLALAA
jgi:hypothetical protein